MPLPNFWCTHIAKVLAGEQPCYLQAWLSGRMKFEKRGDQGALAKWKADHTEQLRQAVGSYEYAGWKCQTEQFFRVTGQHAILSGKADLILQRADSRPLIVDVKSGKPRDSDITQVLIEMVMIPLAWKAPTMRFDGIVQYGTHKVDLTAGQADALRPKVFQILKHLGTCERPSASPGEQVCRFCEVSDEECKDRWSAEKDPEPAMTVEF